MICGEIYVYIIKNREKKFNILLKILEIILINNDYLYSMDMRNFIAILLL